MNIVEIASASDDFNLLVRALSTANLVETVQDATDITVFAPTDAAFVKLAQDLGYEGDAADEDAVFDAIVAALTGLAEDGDPVPLLTDILLYHVAPGARTEPTINGSDGIATLLEGAEIMPMDGALGDGEPDLADPKIVSADIEADNGIIQAIDAVLLPIDIPGNTPPLPTITEIVATSGDGFDDISTDFDMLLAALKAAGLADALDAADADFTVFAPNDGAFIATAQALGYQGTDEAGAFDFAVQALTLLSRGGDPIPLLTAILTYHVSPGAKDSEAVLASETIETLAGIELTVDGVTLVDAEPDLANPTIIAVDGEASNGVVHVIDGVLLPQDLLESNGAGLVDFLIFSQGPANIDLGSDNDFISASDVDDIVVGGSGNDVMVGNGGTDTARFANSFNNYSISIADDGVTISDRSAFIDTNTGQDFLNTFELLEFGDGASFVAEGAVDLSVLQGAAALSGDQFETLVELYVAYFDRAPDALGLLFWGNALANGTSMGEIAELFFDQPETQALHPGDSETGAFVDLGYNHVLERDADTAGRDFWIEALDSGDVSRADFLLELIAGARANDAAADDVRTIEDKTDIGVSYALIKGLTNEANANTVMDTYVRANAETSKADAQSQIEQFATLASGAADGPETIIQIVGAIDDPFAVA